MKNNLSVCASLLAAIAGSAIARADVTVTTSCGSATATYVPAEAKWDVNVTIGSACSANPINVAIRGETTDHIRNVGITATASQIVFVTIRGVNANTSISSVDNISSSGSTSTVIISEGS